MSRRRISTVRAQREAREDRVVDLRHTTGAPFRQIAPLVGLSPTATYQAYERGIARACPPEKREAELARVLEGLDREEVEIRNKLQRNPALKVSQRGEVVLNPDGTPMIDGDWELAAHAHLVRLWEIRSKLLGLYAPTRVAMRVITQEDIDKANADLVSRLPPEIVARVRREVIETSAVAALPAASSNGHS